MGKEIDMSQIDKAKLLEAMRDSIMNDDALHVPLGNAMAELVYWKHRIEEGVFDAPTATEHVTEPCKIKYCSECGESIAHKQKREGGE